MSQTGTRLEGVRLSPPGMLGARAASASEDQRCQDEGRQSVVAAPGQAEQARDKARNNRRWGKRGQDASGPRRRGMDGSYHFTRKGWKQKKPPGAGPVSGSEWTRPEADPAEAHEWRDQRTGWYYIETRPAHPAQFNRAIRTNCQPATQPAHFREKDVRTRRLPECRAPSAEVEWWYMLRHDKNMHQAGRCQVHVCLYCSGDKVKTYSTFVDWRNHLSDTHHHCMEEGDPLLEAAGFKLDSWGRLHELDGSDTDPAYKRIKALLEQYGRYQGTV